jgi:hypothetical protein
LFYLGSFLEKKNSKKIKKIIAKNKCKKNLKHTGWGVGQPGFPYL